MQGKTRQQAVFVAQLLFVLCAALLGTRISDFLLDDVVASGIPYNVLQAADSVYQFVIAGSTLAWGVLVDRVPRSRKLAFLVANTIWVGGALLVGFLPPSITLLVAVEVLWGLGIGAIGPITASFLGDLFEVERRGRLFSLYTVFVYTIKGSAIAVTGLVGSALGDWRSSNAVFGLLGVAALLVFAASRSLPRLAGAEPEIVDRGGLGGVEYAERFRLELGDLRHILSKPSNALFLLQGVSGMVGVTIVTRYMSYWFTSAEYDGMGLETGVAVVLLGLGGAAGALAGILSAGYFIDRNFQRGTPGKALGFATACVFAQVVVYAVILQALPLPGDVGSVGSDLSALLRGFPFFALFVVFFNVAVFFSTPIGTSVNTARTHLNLPEHRGTAAALFDTTDFVGAGIGLLVGASLLAATGSYRAVVQLGTLFWLVSGTLWLGLTQTFGKDYADARRVILAHAGDISGRAL
ncbi:MAG: MFS transporter [Promethearchaeota archaeon]